MRTQALTLVAVLAGLSMTACSIDASILNMDQPAKIVISQEKPGGAEFVAGSTGEYKTTPLRHYKVQAVAGHFIGVPVQETPNRHYIVYSSVQGSMLSQEEEEAAAGN